MHQQGFCKTLGLVDSDYENSSKAKLTSNDNWINGTLETSIIKNVFGLPAIPFDELRDRSARRITKLLKQSPKLTELTFAP